MIKKFDLIVIGTGTAASAVAEKCRSAGWDVAIIDSRPFGGTCALRGCDPKKVLVGAAEVFDWFRRMDGRAVRADAARIEWADLMRFKRSFTDPVPQSRERSFAKAGITAFHGRARFVGSTAIEVGEASLEGRHVVIASGAMPRKLSIPGEQFITTSDRFLELEELPRRIVFIGGHSSSSIVRETRPAHQPRSIPLFRCLVTDHHWQLSAAALRMSHSMASITSHLERPMVRA